MTRALRTMRRTTQATVTGLLAVLLWSSIVGLMRAVSQAPGATGGAAMLYTVASLLLLAMVGPTRIKTCPRRYLAWGSLLFVAYEMCLALSIGQAHGSRQAIEVGMVNYLWPALTMAAALRFNRQKASWVIVPGFVLAVAAVCRCWAANLGTGLRRCDGRWGACRPVPWMQCGCRRHPHPA